MNYTLVTVLFIEERSSMKYKKPVVLNKNDVVNAKCGSGPSGRPCDRRAG